MSDAPTRVVEFDIRGQICPSTLIIALRELNARRQELRGGGVRLVFRTDNRDATITIPDSAMNMGYCVDVTREDDHYLIAVEAGR